MSKIKSRNLVANQIIPEDIFDKSHYASVRLPCEEAETLPSWCYTSDEWYEKEIEKIIGPSWHFVGHASSLPNVGDYITLKFMNYQILVIRGKDHRVRAFHNSCRHRGSKLLEESGNCKGIRCRYHSWNYALDGSLISAPHMSQLDKEEYPLIDIHCEINDGLIFINLNEKPMSLQEYLGDFSKLIKPYCIEDMVCVKQKEFTLQSNWKLYIEVDMETYHTPFIHSNSIGKQLVESIHGKGDWVAVFHKSEKTVALAPQDRDDGFPHISGNHLEGTLFTVLFPGFFIVTAQDSMWWIHKIPEGPETTRVKIGYCFPRETTERSDFEEKSKKYFSRWDQVIAEDNWITEFQQEAIRSSVPGRYSHLESVVHTLDNFILDKILTS